MKIKNDISLGILTLIMVLLLAAGCTLSNNSNNKTQEENIENKTAENETGAEEDKTDQDNTTYSNDQYGFKVTYPSNYDEDDEYGIWDASNIDLIKTEFGINKGQESLLLINVYSKGDKDQVLKDKGYTETEETGLVGSTEARKLLKSPFNGLIVENGDYVYIVTSSVLVTADKDDSYYQEYENLLKNIEFFEVDVNEEEISRANENYNWELVSGNSNDTCSSPTYSGEATLRGYYVYDVNYTEEEWLLQILPEDADKLPVSEVYEAVGYYNNWLVKPQLLLTGATSELETKLKNASAENPIEVIVKGFRAYCEGMSQVSLEGF